MIEHPALAIARRILRNRVLMNYLGMLRPYSLVDLIFQLVAAHASWQQGIGALALWIGFLSYLEWQHQDRGRLPVPWWAWVVGWSLGLGAYFRGEGLLFCALSIAYTAKIFPNMGLVTPFFRGLQNFTLLGGIIGFGAWQPWVALITIGLRNLIGDIRDREKDGARNTLTIPLHFGWQLDWPDVHLWATHATTFMWWLATPIPWWGLVVAWAIQRTTYHWTPR